MLAIALAAGRLTQSIRPSCSTSGRNQPEHNSRTVTHTFCTLLPRLSQCNGKYSMITASHICRVTRHELCRWLRSTPGLTAIGLVSNRERNLYAAAAIAAFGLAPYTQILMDSTNAELSRRATAHMKKADTHNLVRTRVRPK